MDASSDGHPDVLVLGWLLTPATPSPRSWATAAWRARTAPVQVEAQAKPAFSHAELSDGE